MKHQWLKQTDDASNVIVFFSGWGFDASIVQNLSIEEGTNVLFINDYRNLDYELPTLDHYQHRCIIAWSFGVAAYNVWQQQFQHRSPQQSSTHHAAFDYHVAINGSVTAVDRKKGIPDIVMQKTIDTLSTESFQVFAKKCIDPLDPRINSTFDIDVDARKQELQQIQQWQLPDSELQWDKIWISRNDKIFPIRNLQRAWQNQKDRIEMIDAAHAPFHYWQNWHDILV